jgi:hypothetical protein
MPMTTNAMTSTMDGDEDNDNDNDDDGKFDSRPLKVENRPDFLTCRWHATYHWKVLDESYKFALNFISIEGLHTKFQAPKLRKSQLWEFWDFHLGVLELNAIWMLVCGQAQNIL